MRTKVGEALRRLGELGFVDLLDDGRLRVRPALSGSRSPCVGSVTPTPHSSDSSFEARSCLGEAEREADDEVASDEEPSP